MKINILISIIFLSLIALIGCDPLIDTENETKTLFINNSLADCTGVSEQECMQVKESENDDWELFYDKIEDFNYEAGYYYEVNVEVMNIENPPIDRSSIRYKLQEVISKSKEDTVINGDYCAFNGKKYAPGDSFPDTDGCNQCYCDGSGEIACTDKFCGEECTEEDNVYSVCDDGTKYPTQLCEDGMLSAISYVKDPCSN